MTFKLSVVNGEYTSGSSDHVEVLKSLGFAFTPVRRHYGDGWVIDQSTPEPTTEISSPEELVALSERVGGEIIVGRGYDGDPSPYIRIYDGHE